MKGLPLLAIAALAGCSPAENVSVLDGRKKYAERLVFADGDPYRWRSTGPTEGLEFRIGRIDPVERPLASAPSSLHLEDGALLVSTSHEEWYDTRTLFLTLDETPEGWRVRSVGIWRSVDVPPFIGWLLLRSGRVTLESDSCNSQAPLRVDVDISGFRQTFEHTPSDDSRRLAERLRDFEGAPVPRSGK